MQDPNGKYIVVLYWDKTTWYSLGALTASIKAHNIPYIVIKGKVKEQIQKWLDKGYYVIYGESSRNMTKKSLQQRLKMFQDELSSTKLITVIGGPQASGNPQEILSMGANYIVIGEGELTFPDLIKTLVMNNFDKGKYYDLNGIAYLNQNKDTVRTPLSSKIHLDDYCPYSDDPQFPLHPPIELMRGCAFRCRFCQVPYMYGNPRFRSIDSIIKIIKHYIKHFKPLKESIDIRFIAPNSFGYMEKKRGHPKYTALSELVNRIKQLDVRLFLGTFPSEIRPEYITDETLHLFEFVSNKYISIGFQSGSDHILSEMQRGHSVVDGLNAFDLLTSHGLKPIFDFILGTPYETETDQWETLSLIRRFGKKARVRLHYFMPLPSTPWEHNKPQLLYPSVQKEIGRLARDEIVTGEFIKQFTFTYNNKDSRKVD